MSPMKMLLTWMAEEEDGGERRGRSSDVSFIEVILFERQTRSAHPATS